MVGVRILLSGQVNEYDDEDIYCRGVLLRPFTNAIQPGRPADRVSRSLLPARRASTWCCENAGYILGTHQVQSFYSALVRIMAFMMEQAALCSPPRKNYLSKRAPQTPSESHCGIAPALSEAQAGHMS